MELRKNNLSPEQRKVLVIGGAGYIGSVLNKKLLANGYHVRVLDKLMYDNAPAVSHLMEEENFSFVKGDFGDNEILEKVLVGSTDVVLLASLVGDPVCKKYPDLAQKVNLDYPKNLFKKLNNRNINRFIFTSTCSNYGLQPDDTPANENSQLNPQSLYAETKVAFEKFILENLDRIDFSPTILRLSTAFGISPRMRFDLTISEFTKELALGKELLVYDEDTWRPYCNVADISDAIVKVLEMPEEKVLGEVFNIGSDRNNYTKKMIVDLTQKHIIDAVVNYKKGGMDPRNYIVSFEKARNILGFNPRFSAEDSIIHLISAIDNGLFNDIEIRKNFYGNYEIRE